MENNALKKIGYILRFHRRLKEFSQQQMAESLGISTRNFQRIEAGEVEPKLETLIRIANVLAIPLSSLVRPTDASMLAISEVASTLEHAAFQELHHKTIHNDEDLLLTQKLIAQDSQALPSASMEAQLKGTVANVSPALAKHIGIQCQHIDIHPCVVFGSAAERWEFVFRHNLKRAVIENAYIFPTGFKVFKEYHYNLNPNPDHPTSEIYIRDVTENHNLALWIKNIKTSRALS